MARRVVGAVNDAPRITIRNLALGYGGRPVVEQLDWDIAPGSLTAIIGANGSGKSTLLRAVAGELRPLAGAIDGLDGTVTSYLPQDAGIDRAFPISVADLAAMGLWRKVGAFGRIGRHWSGELERALGLVGLSGAARLPIATLSGGQFQRVLFARLILEDADLILLDEPFAAVDRETTADLVGLVRQWAAEGRTVVVALHDLDQVRQHFPETLRLAGGRGVQGATAQILSVLGPATVSTAPAGQLRGGAVA
ncbi:MAG: ABC transporter ATP-binding protein [Bauldia sp.]|nr:ABC transporter ATP-binding protein [Bauldia sp.]